MARMITVSDEQLESIKEYSSLEQLKELNPEEVYQRKLTKAAMILYVKNQNLFSKEFLELNDVIKIFDTKNEKALRKLNPILLGQFNFPLEPEWATFIAQNLTKEQICYLPSRLLKNFTVDDFDYLLNTLEGYDFRTYKQVYVHKTPKKQYKYAIVASGKIGDFLRQQKITARYAAVKAVPKEKYYELSHSKYEKNGWSATEMAKYFSMETNTFKRMAAPEQENELFKVLEIQKEENVYKNDGKQIRYTQIYFTKDSFEKGLQTIYKPVNEEDKYNQEKYMPNTGLYSWEELTVIYGLAGKLKRLQFLYYVRTKLISYFELSPRVFRYSKKDFEDFMTRYIETNWERKKAHKRVNETKKFINIPPNATQEEHDDIMSEYLLEEDVLNYFSVTVKNLEEVQNVYASTGYQFIIQHVSKYYSYENLKTYFKKSDIEEQLLNQYYGKLNPVTKKLEQTPIKYDDIKKLYRINQVADELKEEYPHINENYLKNVIRGLLNDGEIPVFYKENGRNWFVAKEELLKNKKIIKILEKSKKKAM